MKIVSVEKFEHKCNRCGETFLSGLEKPVSCNNCGSAYWNRERVYDVKKKAKRGVRP